ncbi:hypothetical protein LJC27_07500 [Christensenellaceae bacterium OttesenSCG-928-M15]|nr:hypothetical protein [Christensenellaceae bacterium OttesenSCG-928-M15]
MNRKKVVVVILGTFSLIFLLVFGMMAAGWKACTREVADDAIVDEDYYRIVPSPDEEYAAILVESGEMRALTEEEYQYLLNTEFDGSESIIEHLNRLKEDKATLPVPDYLLSADAMEDALLEWGVACTIEPIEGTQQGRTAYGLYNAEDGGLVAGIASNHLEGERALLISLPSFFSANAIPLEECAGAIAFATRLFGGFENEHQVYDSFIKDYNTVNTQRKQYDVPTGSTTHACEGTSRWESDIGGVICEITLEQPVLSEPQEYVTGIAFATNWKVFHIS